MNVIQNDPIRNGLSRKMCVIYDRWVSGEFLCKTMSPATFFYWRKRFMFYGIDIKTGQLLLPL